MASPLLCNPMPSILFIYHQPRLLVAAVIASDDSLRQCRQQDANGPGPQGACFWRKTRWFSKRSSNKNFEFLKKTFFKHHSSHFSHFFLSFPYTFPYDISNTGLCLPRASDLQAPGLQHGANVNISGFKETDEASAEALKARA